MEKNLKKIIKKAKGSLLGIGIENENLIDAINDNDDINVCYLLESKGKKSGKLSFRGKHKKVNIKKLKKFFTKKRTNTIICNYKYIQKFMRHFVPGSVYINNGKLYIYGKIFAFFILFMSIFFFANSSFIRSNCFGPVAQII